MEAYIEEIIETEGLKDFVPMMSSVDVRHDSNDRVCCVDPNRYPQGFNNVCKDDYEQFAKLIDGRIAKDRNISKIHVVEEEYGEISHPYYENLKCLKNMLSLTRVKSVSSSPEIVVENVRTTNPTMNILNTSYPSDIERDGMLRTSSEKDEAESYVRLNTTTSVPILSVLKVDDRDPEWYNTYEKYSLFQQLQRWIDDIVLIWKRRWIELPEDEEEEEEEEILSSNSLNARFDLFPVVCDTVTGEKLSRLIQSKLYPHKSSSETPWTKVFVKDDSGCNGVGMLVFGRKDVKTGKQFRLKLSDRKMLRPRNKSAIDRRLVLQEGIPTCLRNQHTGAQLEIVMMFANGHVYNYFAREIDCVRGQEIEEKGREMKNNVIDQDTCTSLNIPGARFIQRDVFETSPEYRDAFRRVRKHWWKYVLTGRLCVLTMAKQKKEFVNGRKMSFSSFSSSMSLMSLIKTESEKKKKKKIVTMNMKKMKKEKKKFISNKNETQDQFSRRVSGILMRAINDRTKKCQVNKALVREWRSIVGKNMKNEILRSFRSSESRDIAENIVNNLASKFSDVSGFDDKTCKSLSLSLSLVTFYKHLKHFVFL